MMNKDQKPVQQPEVPDAIDSGYSQEPLPFEVPELITHREKPSGTQIELHSGPIPPPDQLKAYMEIDKSFGERIFRLAENAQEMSMYEIRRKRDNEELKIKGDHKVTEGFYRIAITRVIAELVVFFSGFAFTYILLNEFQNVFVSSLPLSISVFVIIQRIVSSFYGYKNKSDKKE